MASKIILKKSVTAAKVPVVGDLEYGELALNYNDGKLYYKKSDGVTPANDTINAIAQPLHTLTILTAATYTATSTSYITTILLCNTTSNNITVTLPTAVGNNTMYRIKKIAVANSMIIDGAGTETIDDSTTVTVTNENESLTLVSDGTNWRVV